MVAEGNNDFAKANHWLAVIGLLQQTEVLLLQDCCKRITH